MCEPIYVSLRLFHCTLYKQLVFDHSLMRKGSVGRSCRAIGSKILQLWYGSLGDFSQGDPGH
jgi:hypothetical protein